MLAMDRVASAGGAPWVETVIRGRPQGVGWEPAPTHFIMTSKDNDKVSPEAAAAYTDRAALHARILAGHLPDVDMLLAGAPFFAGDIMRDQQVWCDSWLLGTSIDDWQRALTAAQPDTLIRPCIQNLRDVGSDDALKTVEHVLRIVGNDDADRMLIYLACSGHDASRQQLVASSRRHSGWQHDEWDRLFITATALGMVYGFRKSMAAYCAAGLKIIETDAGALERFNAAMAAGEKAKTSLGAVVAAVAQAEIEADVLDDRAEIVRSPVLGLVVVPKLPEGGTAWRKEIAKSWGTMAGTPLPLVTRGDVAAHRAALIAQWPHAVEIIDTILGDLAASEVVHFRPTLLVGPPGSGKSSLARAIFDEFGVPNELQSFAGLHDAAIMGTSAQWGSARESGVLQLVKRTAIANPGVTWDELEKASSSRHNGAPAEALLAMLEPDQARRYRDLCLEVECDISAISHFATANSIEGVPRPVIDRMRVLTMPEPGWQHLGTLTRQIVDRIAKERGIDARWFTPLAEDEMDLVRGAWPGGSIRQLSRIVQTIIDGRELIMGRC